MQLRLKNLSKQQKQAVVLYISTLAGTLLGVLSSVVNTHFISPEDYGDVRYVQNLVAFIASFLLFGYFLSGSRLLALSDDPIRSRSIKGVMVLILLVASGILLLGTFICGLFHYSNPKIFSLFLLAMPVCFFPLFQSYISNTAQGDNQIGRLAINNCLPYILYVSIAYLTYKYTGGSSEKMLLLQWGIYTLVAFCVIFSTRPLFRNVKTLFKELDEENRRYGIQLYFGSLVMIGCNYLAGITLGIFNTDNVNVGFYTLALSVTAPLAMLPGIIGTTYFKQFAKQDYIPKKVLRFTVLLAVISCIAFVLLIKPIVVFLYTEAYSKVGVYASWMSVGFCVHGIGDMLNRYLGSHGQGKAIRNSSFVCGLIKIVGFTLFVYLWNINGAVVANLLGSSAYFIVLLVYYNRFVKHGTTV